MLRRYADGSCTATLPYIRGHNIKFAFGMIRSNLNIYVSSIATREDGSIIQVDADSYKQQFDVATDDAWNNSDNILFKYGELEKININYMYSGDPFANAHFKLCSLDQIINKYKHNNIKHRISTILPSCEWVRSYNVADIELCHPVDLYCNDNDRIKYLSCVHNLFPDVKISLHLDLMDNYAERLDNFMFRLCEVYFNKLNIYCEAPIEAYGDIYKSLRHVAAEPVILMHNDFNGRIPMSLEKKNQFMNKYITYTLV